VAEKRVPVLAPDPKTGALRFATVNESHAEAVVKAGGKVLSAKEAAAEQLHADYEAKGTAEKVVGGATALAAGPIAGNALSGAGVITVAPEVQALQQGESTGLTAGLDQVAVHHALEAVAGKDAAKAYAQNQKAVAEAHSGFKTAGELAGFAAAAYGGSGLGGAARALPGVGISAVGGAAEGVAARALGGVAAKGVLGRALATSGELAARGAVEGALYGAANEITEADLGDRDVAADKLFSAMGHGALFGGLGGAALGGTGSLAKSAVGGTVKAIRGGLSKAALAAEEAGEGALAKDGSKSLANATDSWLHNKADDLALDALGATKVQARNAMKGFSEAEQREVASYVRSVAIEPAAKDAGVLGAAFKAGAEGRADDMLAKIAADKYGRVAEGLSGAVKGTKARVEVGTIGKAANDLADDMLKDPVRAAGAKSFLERAQAETDAIMRSGKVDLATNTMDAADAFYLRARMEKAAYEMGRQNNAAGEAYKQWMRKWDAHVVNAIDEAAAKAGSDGTAAEIRHWKRQWRYASAAEEMAELGAESVKRNNIFGIREAIGGAAGIAAGHPLLGLGTMVGGKVLKERGAAAASALLGKMADLGTLSTVVRKMDDQIGRSAKGLLSAPAKGTPYELPTGTTRERADQALKAVTEAKADPEAFIAKVARTTEPMATSAPELAGALAQRMTDAVSFLASKVPSPPPPDPLDPHPTPMLTDAEASRLAKYAWYTERPARFFEEVEHGHLTFEGIETAKALMPGAFAELQARTAEGLATLAAQGRKPPFAERQKLGALLDFPATISQGFAHAQFLQKNAVLASQAASGPAPAPKRATSQISTQRSPLDRLEASGPGRR
jgi:hypothetical protein